jgi:hypothetical protein|tara:strand:- start:3061 stop:3357 length:297 start_codon:yes stop_codon:yes gene_type:complete
MNIENIIVNNIKELRTGAWTLDVVENNKTICEASNSGRGGCNDYSANNPSRLEELKKYFDGRVGQAEGLDSVLSCAEEGDTLDVALEKLEDFYAEFFK